MKRKYGQHTGLRGTEVPSSSLCRLYVSSPINLDHSSPHVSSMHVIPQNYASNNNVISDV